MSGKIYGYARVSTAKQSINRQIENIKREYPNAIIITETFTGTTTDRPAFTKLCKKVNAGDTIVFDEVSRMARNADEGYQVYQELYCQGVELVFLKEHYVDTKVFKERTNKRIDNIKAETGSDATNKFIKAITSALNDYSMDIAKEQIELAFKAAQAEVDRLHVRTREGIATARAAGKHVGRPQGAIIETKKAKFAKATILKYSKDFGGSMNDPEVRRLVTDQDGNTIKISRNSYYKYKAELKAEQARQ